MQYVSIYFYNNNENNNILVTRSVANAIDALTAPPTSVRQFPKPQPIRNRRNTIAAPPRRTNAAFVRQRRQTFVRQGRQTISFQRRESVAVQVDIPTQSVGIQVDIENPISTEPRRNSVNIQVPAPEEQEVWCICRREDNERPMIFCDNAECVIKWFHFDCVGIDTAPEGNWYCANCALLIN